MQPSTCDGILDDAGDVKPPGRSAATLEVLDAATVVRPAAVDVAVAAHVVVEVTWLSTRLRLDDLANRYFPGRVVRRTSCVRSRSVSVPGVRTQFLLGKYCASDDPTAIEAGLAVVNQTLADQLPG